jgi:hypothetical protein
VVSGVGDAAAPVGDCAVCEADGVDGACDADGVDVPADAAADAAGSVADAEAAGWVGAAVVPDVPVGDGVWLALAAADGEAFEAAEDGDALALAAALGSSLLGTEAEPRLIAAAKAARWVRASWTLARAVASRVAASDSFVPAVACGAVEPEVPTASDALAPAEPPASNSLMMRSAEAASLLQFADFDLSPDAACSSELMWRFSSATRDLVVPLRDASGMSASADWA